MHKLKFYFRIDTLGLDKVTCVYTHDKFKTFFYVCSADYHTTNPDDLKNYKHQINSLIKCLTDSPTIDTIVSGLKNVDMQHRGNERDYEKLLKLVGETLKDYSIDVTESGRAVILELLPVGYGCDIEFGGRVLKDRGWKPDEMKKLSGKIRDW